MKHNPVAHRTLWGLLIEKKQQDFAEVAYQLIGSYATLVDERRWYRSWRSTGA